MAQISQEQRESLDDFIKPGWANRPALTEAETLADSRGDALEQIYGLVQCLKPEVPRSSEGGRLVQKIIDLLNNTP